MYLLIDIGKGVYFILLVYVSLYSLLNIFYIKCYRDFCLVFFFINILVKKKCILLCCVS